MLVRRDLDVRGLEIAMDDPFFVGRFERFGHLPAEGEGALERDRALGNVLGERVSFDELHDEKVALVGLLHSVQGRNVGVIERRERFRFTLEAEQALAIGGESLEDHLDGDIAAEPGVMGSEDLAHAPCAEPRQDSVRAEICAGSEGHSRMRHFGLRRLMPVDRAVFNHKPGPFARDQPGTT
jgi:hypothetical protein